MLYVLHSIYISLYDVAVLLVDCIILMGCIYCCRLAVLKRQCHLRMERSSTKATQWYNDSSETSSDPDVGTNCCLAPGWHASSTPGLIIVGWLGPPGATQLELLAYLSPSRTERHPERSPLWKPNSNELIPVFVRRLAPDLACHNPEPPTADTARHVISIAGRSLHSGSSGW
jgi:hypothetical protein